MDSRTGKALLIGLAIATGTAVACSDGPTQAPTTSTDQGTGVVGLRLQLAPGVTISTLHWAIHNTTLLPGGDLTGTVDVSQSQAIQFVVGGIPAGPGYTITLTASTDGANPLTCVGSAMFAVIANATSPVSVSLVCTGGGTGSPDAGNTGSILINGTTTIAASCAAVTSLSASPSTVNVGASIGLSATGIDASGSTSTVNFGWAVTGGTGTGTFDDTHSATPSFKCTGPGPVTVTVTAATTAGGTCTNNTATANLTCTTPGADAGAPDTGMPDTGTPDTGTPDTGTPDTGTPDTGTPDTGTPDTGTPDTGTPDTGTPDTGTPDTGTPDTGTPDTGTPDTGAAADAGITTLSILGARSALLGPDTTGLTCTACAQTNGCLTAATSGASCEELSPSANATLFAGALPDGKTCSAVVGAAPVSEIGICLQTLDIAFASKCAASFQATPCLCGATDASKCLAGTAVPTGAAFDIYACDFNTTSGSTINSDFVSPLFGAGKANSLISCLGAFGCNCF